MFSPNQIYYLCIFENLNIYFMKTASPVPNH